MKKAILALMLLFGTSILAVSCTADEETLPVVVASDKDEEPDK